MLEFWMLGVKVLSQVLHLLLRHLQPMGTFVLMPAAHMWMIPDIQARAAGDTLAALSGRRTGVFAGQDSLQVVSESGVSNDFGTGTDLRQRGQRQVHARAAVAQAEDVVNWRQLLRVRRLFAMLRLVHCHLFSITGDGSYA